MMILVPERCGRLKGRGESPVKVASPALKSLLSPMRLTMKTRKLLEGWRPSTRSSAGDLKKRPLHGIIACSQCDFSTSLEGKMRLHQKCHVGKRPFQCHLCRAAFTTKATLIRHMRMHTGERPFQCHSCSKAFVDGGHLARHLRTHTGERPFGCPLCEATFKRKDHVKVHLRTHSSQLSATYY